MEYFKILYNDFWKWISNKNEIHMIDKIDFLTCFSSKNSFCLATAKTCRRWCFITVKWLCGTKNQVVLCHNCMVIVDNFMVMLHHCEVIVWYEKPSRSDWQLYGNSSQLCLCALSLYTVNVFDINKLVFIRVRIQQVFLSY